MKNLSWEDYKKALNTELTNPVPQELLPPVPEEIKIDSRQLDGKGWFLPIKGERFDGHSAIKKALKEKKALGCFCEESYRNNFCKNLQERIVFVKSSFETLKKIASYKRLIHTNITVFAVTGSLGKTSTKNLLASILKQTNKAILISEKNYNTEIGISLTLLKLNKDHKYVVLEMGARKALDIKVLKEIAQPTICMCLMVGSSHIGIFGSKENIYKAKLEIIDPQVDDQKNIVLHDDPILLKKAKKIDQNCFTYGYAKEANARITFEKALEDGSMKANFLFQEENFPVHLKGYHQALAQNALAASFMAHLAGIKTDVIQKGLKDFCSTEARFQTIDAEGYILIDDSYNASSESIKAGINTLQTLYKDKKITYILGDILDLKSFSDEQHLELAHYCQKNLEAFNLITIGKGLKKAFDKVSNKHPLPFEIFSFSSSEEFLLSHNKKIPLGDVLYFKGSQAMGLKKIINSFLRK